MRMTDGGHEQTRAASEYTMRMLGGNVDDIAGAYRNVAAVDVNKSTPLHDVEYVVAGMRMHRKRCMRQHPNEIAADRRTVGLPRTHAGTAGDALQHAAMRIDERPR